MAVMAVTGQPAHGAPEAVMVPRDAPRPAAAPAPPVPQTLTLPVAPADPPTPVLLPEGIELPPYSVWRRIPEWEPHGPWLRDRPQLEWPDTIYSTTKLPWVLRLLLVVGLALGQVVMDGGPVAHLIAAGLLLLLWGWIEWWQTWDLTPLSRRLIAITVQFVLIGLLIVVSPLSALIIWSHYVICGTFFTGPLLLAGLAASSALMTAVQVGGFDEYAHNWSLTAGLLILDMAIGVVTIGMANRREEAVMRRHAATHALLAEQQRNAELQAQLMGQARAMGIREERARLARELHDTVAQGLVAVVTQLEAIDDATLPAATQRRVANAKSLARQGLSEARRAVDALRPPLLEDADLPDALSRLLQQWSEVNHIPADLSVSGTARATDADPALIRVTQEALSNVARHAHAQRVAASLDYLEGEVLLDIHDDGVGFDPGTQRRPSAAGGQGLPGMAERIRLLGGSLAVESEPGGGCVISAAVPG
jgi:signal transduction histidine kinase